MALRALKMICRAIPVVAFALLLGATAWASMVRPNALDRRVDALTTQALLSEPATSLVDPARQAAAVRRAHWTLAGWLLIPITEAIALFYMWTTGGAASLRDWLRRRIRSEWLVRFLFGASLALVARLASFVPSFYLYRVDRALDVTFELTRFWFAFWIYHTLLAMIVAGLIAAIVLWLASRTHQWYAYTIVGILAVSVGWSYAAPFVQSPFAVHPISGPLGPRLHALVQHARLPNVAIYVASAGNTPLGEAEVLGLGVSRRIQLTDTLIAGGTPAEIEYEVAYDLGKMARHDLFEIALIEGGVVIIFAALAVVIADRIRFRRDDDPLSRLAIVGALLALVYIVAVPVRNAALRSYDLAATRYAVALTGDPAAAVRALVRATDQQMEEVCPETSAMLFLYTEPGIGERIAAINRIPSGCR
jgi:Zn-dependent protease with chaperone function